MDKNLLRLAKEDSAYIAEHEDELSEEYNYDYENMLDDFVDRLAQGFIINDLEREEIKDYMKNVLNSEYGFDIE